LVGIYEGKLPFSARNLEILKRVMVSEQSSKYVIRSKTGWSRLNGKDVGWWVGYVERKENAFFFATRVSKSRSEINPNFSACRKEITKKILRQLKVID
jgi:beta-lactamase class D